MLQAEQSAARLGCASSTSSAWPSQRPCVSRRAPRPRHCNSKGSRPEASGAGIGSIRLLERRASVTAAASRSGSGSRNATAERSRRQQGSNGRMVGSGKGDIFGRLLDLQDLQDARRMVTEEGGNFSPANSSTALKRVAYLSQDLPAKERRQMDQDSLLVELRGIVDSKLPRMEPPQLADVVWAYGRMENSPGTAMLESIAATCEAKSEQLTSSDITKLMWGYAKLQFLPEGLFRSISERIALDDMESFTAHSISNMVWACATLKFRDPAMLTKLARVSTDRLGEFAPQGLSNTLWGFATLEHREQELLEGIAMESTRQLGSFTTKGLVNLLWCYGVFGYSPPQLLPEALEAAGKRMYKGTPVDASNLAVTCARLDSAPPEVMAAILDRAEASISLFQPPELAGLVWALGRLQHKVPSELQKKLCGRAGQVSNMLKPTEVTNALYGLSRWSGSSRVPEDALEQLLARANELVPSMDAPTASCAVQALARLSGRISPTAALASFVADAKALLVKETEQQPDLLPMKEAVQLLWAFAKLESRVARWFVNAEGSWQEGTTRAQRYLPAALLEAPMREAESLGCHDLALLMWACGAVRQPLPDAQSALLAARTGQLMGKLSMMELSMCVWGLAKMEYLDEDLMDLVAALIENKLQGPCCPQDVVMLLCSCAVLRYRNIPMVRTLVSWTLQNIADLSIVDMCNTMWAMAELYYSPGRAVMQRLEGQLSVRGGELEAKNRSTLKWARRRLIDIDEAKMEQMQARRDADRYDSWMSSSSAADRARQRRFDSLDGDVWDIISRSIGEGYEELE